ncbi:hypothetical protein B484DRAFT_443486 [Ochromonadaceae sp. CCMP2298]|nr:hypothetical protein B484DRAFT_443486 [Ochromonadaceae sp. CCMP2298]
MGTGQGVLEVPLMDSQSARVFVEGAYRGTTSTYATPIGSAVRLDLGPDPLLSVTCTAVPSSGSEEEERGWFMSDKVKYSIQVVQYAITLVSAHPLPHLAVISDYLPHPSTDEIKVELLSPPAKGLTKFPDSPKTSKDSKVPISQSSQEVYGEEEFVSRVLAHPALQAPAEAGVFAFLAGGSHNLVFAKWVMPGESVTTLLKYRIVWPEGKQISQDNFQA